MERVKLRGVAISCAMAMVVACAGEEGDAAAAETAVDSAGPSSSVVASATAEDSGPSSPVQPSGTPTPPPAAVRPAQTVVRDSIPVPPPKPAAAAPVKTEAPTATTTPLPQPSPGLYTAAQAKRGEEVYAMICSQCHTTTQYSGPTFVAGWHGRRVFDLYDLISNTMPMNDPGTLSSQEYIDVIAYILKLNGVPAGKAELRPDAAALKQQRILIKGAPPPS